MIMKKGFSKYVKRTYDGLKTTILQNFYTNEIHCLGHCAVFVKLNFWENKVYSLIRKMQFL